MRGHMARCPGWRSRVPWVLVLFVVCISCTALYAESSALIYFTSTNSVVAQGSRSCMKLLPSFISSSQSLAWLHCPHFGLRAGPRHVLQLSRLRWTIRHQPQNPLPLCDSQRLLSGRRHTLFGFCQEPRGLGAIAVKLVGGECLQGNGSRILSSFHVRDFRCVFCGAHSNVPPRSAC